MTTDQLATTSEPFVGQWNRLVSTTNWDKGRIVYEWRTALIEAQTPASEYSDEVWCRLVGGVSPQHVGRLRRVHERFGGVRLEYDGLYWSHFFAALDWDDAEMWLEGSLQNDWSVSQMRKKRWETLGAIESERPLHGQIVSSDTDEDVVLGDADSSMADTIRGTSQEVQGQSTQHGTAEDASSVTSKGSSRPGGDTPRDEGAAIYADDTPESTVPFVRPFENLGELPADLTAAFEDFKLAILRHKANGWKEISRDDVLSSLEALKELATAPSEEVLTR